MPIPIESSQLFRNGSRIEGLPAAIANGQALTYEQLGLDAVKRRCVYYTDCFTANGSTLGEFTGVVFNSGSINTPSGVSLANRPGMIRARSSTTANSGYAIAFSINSLLLRGSEYILAGWIPSAFATVTTRFGLHDSVSNVDVTDGAYIEIDATGVARGKTANNSVRSTTVSSFAIVAGIYYWMQVQLNADATIATFTIRTEAGAVLWTDTLNSNIPTAAGREAGAGIVSNSSGTVAVDLYHLDFIGVELFPTRW
jgi:hypothetical protein